MLIYALGVSPGPCSPLAALGASVGLLDGLELEPRDAHPHTDTRVESYAIHIARLVRTPYTILVRLYCVYFGLSKYQ